MLPKDKYFYLKQNSFFSIAGKDKYDFIQGLISNDIFLLKKNKSIYSAMLSPQGKFLFDFFIISYNDQLIFECSEKTMSELIKKLEFYKLQRDIKIKKISIFKSYLLNPNNFNDLDSIEISEDLFYFIDPRNNNFFLKVYSTEKIFFDIKNKLELSELTFEAMEKERLKNTIPDSTKDFEINKSLLLELRLDKLNCISWEKGCYMGQELTARTKYRGNVKKKLYGLKIKGDLKKQKEIYFKNKLIGEIKSYDKNLGIGILKIEESEECINQNLKMRCGNALIEPFKPVWDI